ncbi:MAG: flagellar biosynthesis anti-sigma factor FlgM [Bryobacteraceae bacterium]
MQEKEAFARQFVETLRAAAAAVGQVESGLDVDRARSFAGIDVRIDNDREARIAELRRQHQEGSYRPDPADVAARIVDDHLA